MTSDLEYETKSWAESIFGADTHSLEIKVEQKVDRVHGQTPWNYLAYSTATLSSSTQPASKLIIVSRSEDVLTPAYFLREVFKSYIQFE